MTNQCIRICFTASDKFNLITRDTHLSSFLRLFPRKANLIVCDSLKETARIQSYKESMIQDRKDSRGISGILGFKYSGIAFLKDCSRSLANCCLLLPRLCSGSHVAPLLVEVYLATFLFLRNKYVSHGKQEAISTGLADQAIPAIP